MNIREFTSGYIPYFFLAFLIVIFLFFLNIAAGPTYGGDSEWYIAAAEGRLDDLITPYSGRFLHPFIVGSLDHIIPLDLYQIFLRKLINQYMFLLLH